ncbi:MAG: amidinotransferase [Deltaproteobacteria bacterium]|jgi:dimethylargininase|nr:amidinotransferase [Deltaproteobacteria bacterium]
MKTEFTRAIVRKPGPNFADGLTTSDLGRPDFDLMNTQHDAYVRMLRELGLAVTVLPPETGFPDAHFVEDTAVVTPDIAVITNPGAPARQGEEKTVEAALAGYRTLARIEPPGTLDGGDVLMVGSHFFIGISERTNRSGAEQLGGVLSRYGNTWMPVSVGDGLHLKSGVNIVGPNTLLLTETFARMDAFAAYEKILLDPDESYAGNSLLINGHLIVPQGFPRTQAKLESLGIPLHVLDVSEVRKMDGGLTCLSLRF